LYPLKNINANHLFLLPTILFGLVFISFIFSDYVSFFDYHKTAILNGELWRIFTGHLFHTNGFHVLLNLAGLSLLTLLHRSFYTPRHFILLILCSMLFISISLLLQSDLEHYVGLSGVLHTLFVWGALKDIEHKEKTGILLFLGIWLKVIFEQLNGASEQIATLIDASVAIDAHFSGTLFGTLYFLLPKLLKYGRINKHM